MTKARREGRNAGRTAGAVICGLLEFCLSEGVEALSGVVDAWWLPRFHDMGWTVRPLGLPEFVSGGWVVAVEMPISFATLVSTRQFHGISGSVLAPEGAPAPVVGDVVR